MSRLRGGVICNLTLGRFDNNCYGGLLTYNNSMHKNFSNKKHFIEIMGNEYDFLFGKNQRRKNERRK